MHAKYFHILLSMYLKMWFWQDILVLQVEYIFCYVYLMTKCSICFHAVEQMVDTMINLNLSGMNYCEMSLVNRRAAPCEEVFAEKSVHRHDLALALPRRLIWPQKAFLLNCAWQSNFHKKITRINHGKVKMKNDGGTEKIKLFEEVSGEAVPTPCYLPPSLTAKSSFTNHFVVIDLLLISQTQWGWLNVQAITILSQQMPALKNQFNFCKLRPPALLWIWIILRSPQGFRIFPRSKET